MLFLDSVYVRGTEPAGTTPPRFRRVAAPSALALQGLVECIAERVGRVLERQGLLVRDCEESYLAIDPESEARPGGMSDLLGHSIAYRIAVEGSERATLERLCHYLTRPAVSTERFDRHRDLPPLQRDIEGHREHRRPRRDRAHPRTSGTHGPGTTARGSLHAARAAASELPS